MDHEERKNVINGIKPSFVSHSKMIEKTGKNAREKNRSKLSDYPQTKRKRVLKRVHRNRSGSESSYSSIESDWVTVMSNAPPTPRNEPETALKEKESPIESIKNIYGQSDAFTSAISKQGDSTPR